MLLAALEKKDALIFRNERTELLRQLLNSCKRDVDLWRFRLPVKDRYVANAWGVVFYLAI